MVANISLKALGDLTYVQEVKSHQLAELRQNIEHTCYENQQKVNLPMRLQIGMKPIRHHSAKGHGLHTQL
jgi:hypothetical protein